MENETRNRASLVENRYQEGVIGMTYQAKEERVTQLANTQSSSHYPHDENELYNTAQAKVRGRTAEEIRHWKESAEVADEVASYNMFDPVDKFQDYYQQLCPTRQEQEQYLAQINTYLCENCLIPCQSQCCEECQDKRDLERKMEIENQQSQNQSINQQDSPDNPESEKFVAYTNLEQVTNI
ncbi:hypothetical protein G9A89_010140 [Geosiphon pyriformis]|nr:hypothetical protein G9A89_010140 [Geosiphon pyriformis]